MSAKVLVVEDEDALATLLEYNLAKEGYEISLAPDGEEALLRVDEEAPDLVILDWMLPKVSGIEVCRRLRQGQKTRNIPIIMLTARGEETDRIRGLDTVWGSEIYVEARTVDVHIGRLRKALGVEGADPIRTVRSAGYSLDLD